MNYQETIGFLYSRLPMFSRIGEKAIKKDLHNTRALCEHLGHPEKKLRSIHVAGTNGKGSVSHCLAAILQTAGYRTGLYTSPHLRHFGERIRVNGQMADEDFVIKFTERILPLIDRIEPSFFEVTVAMAFEYFAEQKVDLAVIETGLGGRLDSTNIILPVLSVITQIGWDHMSILGDSLEKIAREKAGIIKQDTPVVVGEVLPETKPVFESAAREKNADLFIASHRWETVDWHWQEQKLLVTVKKKEAPDAQTYHLDLPGIYQVKNLLTVLESTEQLISAGFQIPEPAIHTGLANAKKLTGLHGRWETLHLHPQVIADVAHNPDGIRQLVQQVEITPHNELHIIFGVVKDKDISQMLKLLPKQACYYFTRSQIPRALDENELAVLASQEGLEGKTFSNVNEALEEALVKAGPRDLVIICGSIFLVGEINSAVHPFSPTHT